jgi:adenylate cyclase
MPGRMTAEQVRAVLTGENPGFARHRRRFHRVPSSSRCKICEAPFDGAGGVVFRQFGYGRFPGNPALCSKCVVQLRKQGLSGVEIPVSLLFSDVRGSTGMGERMLPTEFYAFLHRFYRLASDVIAGHDGIVDKIVGDEVIGLFFGGISGPHHTAAALEAALDLAEHAARPNASPSGPIPIGTAVHTGIAFVGATGPEGTVEDFTALGDPVNATARLASAAAAGEVLVSLDAARAAGVELEGRERRSLLVRGRDEPIDVVAVQTLNTRHE